MVHRLSRLDHRSVGRRSVLATLADERLWRAFQAIGIQGMHTGPMKRSGGVRGLAYTPSVDGNFDRISFEIDPAFGTETQYKDLVAAARTHGAIVIGDIIPGHTGKGADFRLAERAYARLPRPLPHGAHRPRRLGTAATGAFRRRQRQSQSSHGGRSAGQGLHRRDSLNSSIFYEPAVKDTDWSATDVVRGVDGVQRRWVYLHYFKQGQPTLNWLDPTFAAERLVIGDAVHELGVLGDWNAASRCQRPARHRARPQRTGPVGAGHPLSVTANQLIADMVRKLGGFTFQELA